MKDFYVTLPSSTTDSVDNTLPHYVRKFRRPFELGGQRVVALVEITTATFWYNVDEKHCRFSVNFNNTG